MPPGRGTTRPPPPPPPPGEENGNGGGGGGRVWGLVVRLSLAMAQVRERHGPWVCYGVAAAMATLAFALRWWLLEGDTRFPFLLSLPPVVLASALFGAGPGIVAGLTGLAHACLFLLEPVGSINVADPDAQAGLAIYAGLVLLVALAMEAATVARRNTERALRASERHARERDKAAAWSKSLLFELRHRRRNDLMRVAAIGHLMAHDACSPECRAALTAYAGRVTATGHVHDILAESMEGPDEPVDSGVLVHGLVDRIRGMPARDGAGEVGWDVEAESYPLPHTVAVPLGLVLFELATNALRHAFPDGRPGTVRVRFRREPAPATYSLVVEDDGVGLPEEGLAGGGGSRASGRRLMRAFARDLRGSFAGCRIGTGGGTRCELRFPVY
jgi:two-component system, sensor histidine kinase PdtaS